MPKKRLTDASVKRLKPPTSGQVDTFDQGYPGLALRLSYGGGRSFVFFYRVGGKLRRLTLGTYPALGLAEAREAWRQARQEVATGRDPGRSGVVGAGATDFRGVFEEWLERDQSKNRSASIVRKKLEKNVLPHWANRPIGTITRRDVLDVIDRIADRGAVTQARRVHGYLARMFGWAQGRGIIEINPLTNLPKPGSETKRDRVLTDVELTAVWNAASEFGFPYGDAIKLLILTGARRDEIGRLNWSEVTPAYDAIALEGSRTKTGVPHIIPLSAPARGILETLPRIADSQWVFTTRGQTPIADWGRAKAKLDQASNVETWTIHDLRRTTATGLQKLGVQLQVTEACLGHTAGSRGGIVGVYQRHDYANEKRAALEAWGQHVLGLIDGRSTAQVVPLRRG